MKDNVQLIEGYFKDLLEIHQTGAGLPETSYYGSLEKLLNGIGKTLKPQVRCVIQLANYGAGQPDGGLFTNDQWEQGNEQTPLLGQLPSRGVIEIKSSGDDAWVIAESGQVSKYWKKYQLVVVTNYRDFVLVGKDLDGKPFKLESFRLATSEADFWTKVAHPDKFAHERGEALIEFLRRTMLQAPPISSPKDLAWFLASYARTANTRLEGKNIPEMDTVRSALEAALGLKFEGDKGKHFFHSTLVQTIFYGLFSAWVLWSKKRSYTASGNFSWHDALWELKVPVMQALFGQIVTPAHVGPLELEDTLDWASSTLNRVDRSSFFNAFEESKAVQYFYEPFLEAFDPTLRKQLGVWYTPPEVVRYMVSRVDSVLKEELGIADGLADQNVYILDPCCGTGSYLVEVLKHIHETLETKGADALSANDLKQAALKRVFGFEILPAPFVVAHMQLGILLQNLGAPLSDTTHERAGVYLTNALTGWEPMDPEKEKAFQAMLTGFPQLLEEQADARKVKQQVPILVILGNPPYNAFAGTATTQEEKDSVTPYKSGLVKKWGIKKFNLDDLYVRFFRMAERRIAEQTHSGVVCLISNFSYLSETSFVVMRERFLSEFDRLWLDNMNGDSRETGKRTPDNRPDPSVFSTEYNRAGIKKGTAITILVRKINRETNPIVRYRQFWGKGKRADLLKSLDSPNINNDYKLLQPTRDNRYYFRVSDSVSEYMLWPKLTEISTSIIQGMDEDRANALIEIEFQKLEKQMEIYFDKSITWEQFAAIGKGLSRESAGFIPQKVRVKAQKEETFDKSNICNYSFRPFDLRWCYYSKVPNVWKRSRPELWRQRWEGNAWLISRAAGVAEPEGVPFYFSRNLTARDSMRGHAVAFPIRLLKEYIPNKNPKEQGTLITSEEDIQTAANLTPSARNYLNSIGIDNLDLDVHNASLIWMHALAIGYCPAYLHENADGIRKDWPRIPLPNNKELLEASSALGRRVADLLDTENPVSGVTASPIKPEIQNIAVVARQNGGELQLPDELAITAGWGHAGQNGIVMPGKGKAIERDYTTEEKQSIINGATNLGIPGEKTFQLLGERTLDIYFNEFAYLKNIPVNVYNCVIGGYQVIKKWLSYREYSLQGRPLKPEEIREVMNMARRITAILLLHPSLDNNYHQCKTAVSMWHPNSVIANNPK